MPIPVSQELFDLAAGRIWLAASSVALATATTGLIWTAAGVCLLLWGWIALSHRSGDRRSLRTPVRSVTVSRLVAGGLIAGGATLLGALIAGEGGPIGAYALARWELLFARFAAHEAVGFGQLARSGFLAHALASAGRDVGVGFVRMLEALSSGFGSILRAATFGTGLGAQYVIANQIALVAAIATGVSVGRMSLSSRWSMSGVATYIGLDLMALGFLAVSLSVVETATNSVAAALGFWLVGIVLFGFLLFLAYQFYALEHLAGANSAESNAEGDVPPLPDPPPLVLVQVASFNEPVEIVEECLRRVRLLDYPATRFAVQLCDDSTDAGLVTRLRSFCRANGIDFQHRDKRRGFKAGALNDGLRNCTLPVEFIAIVDADYQVDPRFLRRIVPRFTTERTGFVQTPQAYRNVSEGSLARWYELADAYFYDVVQPIRARFQSMIFCGTMGVLRRAALDDAGGWSEDCVTEDAELTIRMLARGWTGKYVQEVLGWGLAPDLMTAVRSQQRRWAFGGVQMLRLNRRLLASRRLSFRQRADFLLTGLFWFDGVFLIGVAGAIASLVVASWFGIWLPFAAVPAPAIVAVAPALLMFDGLLKIRASMRRSRPVSFRDVLGVLSFWYAIKLNDLRAAVRAWFGLKMAFVRTPKVSVRDRGKWPAFRAALRTSRAETAIALTLVGVILVSLGRWRFTADGTQLAYTVFLVWLAYYAYAFLSTLWFDYRSRLSVMSAPQETTAASNTPPATS